MLDAMLNEAECKAAASSAAMDKVKSYVAKGNLSGITQKQHCGILVHVALEIQSVDERPIALFWAFQEVANASALRQKMEKAGVLQKSAANAEEIEKDYL